MFKGFQSKNRQFNGFPNLNFQQNNEAYGFSGCTFWLDAAYGTNTQTNLGAVSTWQSKIGLWNFIQNTAANQPRYITNDLNFNNLPSIDFSVDANRILSLPTSTLIGLSNPGSVIWIVYKNTTVINNNICLFNSIGGTTTPFLSLGGTDAAVNGFSYMSSTSVSQIGSGVEDTIKHIGILKVDKGGLAEILIDGITKVTGTVTNINSFNQLGSTAFGANIRGQIAEIGILNNNLNSNNLIVLSDRINTKYAIY